MTRAAAPMSEVSPPRAARGRRARVWSRAALALAILGGAVAGSAAGCGAGGLVGGDCATGYTQCGLACFDLEIDPANCGACGHACPPNVACAGGVCAGSLLDGSALDDGEALTEDGEVVLTDGEILLDGEICTVNDAGIVTCPRRPGPDASDGSDDDAADAGEDGNGGGDGSPSGDGSSSGGDGSMTNGDATSSSPDGCAPPFDTTQNCGACGNTCAGANGVCELVDGGFQCAPTCAPPLADCAGQCVNLLRDPKNCGACGTVCASQYCYLATCQGSVAGNIIVIGHDFQKTLGTDEEAKLLTNAVFYNDGAVNLVSFEHYADAPTVTNGLGLLTAYAKKLSIVLNVQSTADDTVLSNDTLLASASVVLVWDQPTAASGALGSLGQAAAPHLSKFVQGGGIVITLDADQGVGEMPAFLTRAALLAVTGHGAVAAGSPADVPLAGLSIARGMTSVYAVEQNTAWFTTSEPMTTTTLYVANVQGVTSELLAVQKVIN
jgi:hypothetical protein